MAAAGEHYETTEMYPNFADVAEKEGFGEIAEVFRNIAVAEKRHENRFTALAKNITNGTVFKTGKAGETGLQKLRLCPRRD